MKYIVTVWRYKVINREIIIVRYTVACLLQGRTSSIHTGLRCSGKLLLQVMHYNIALLPKQFKVTTLLSYFLWKVMCYVTFELLFKSGQGLIVCF